jgi:hypothetical protein
MSARRSAAVALALAVGLGAIACDRLHLSNPFHRKVEPFDASEQPREPDLSKIFPEGAERAMAAPAEMPPSPEELTGEAPALAGMTAPENAGPPITGTISLAAGAAVPAGATLFVIARTGAAGPPTAVLRLPAPRFPFAFRLGPEDRMIAESPWEGPFQITARIDLDGNATTRDAGDLEGSAEAPASPGDSGVSLTLGSGG